MDQDEMSILYRGPSIDASYQVSGRQTTDDGRQVMEKGHVAFGKVSLKKDFTIIFPATNVSISVKMMIFSLIIIAICASAITLEFP
jgi:hypothetical protein